MTPNDEKMVGPQKKVPTLLGYVYKGCAAMNLQDFREVWVQRWDEIVSEAISSKDPNLATFGLRAMYKDLNDDQRPWADQVIAERVTSTDPQERFGALLLVDEFMIHAALPQLRALETDCHGRTDPGGPYELAKIRRIIDRLGAAPKS
jgi:hypothetical protein